MEQANTGNERRLLAALVVAALLLYWIGNAQTPLWDRDEPRFAQAAGEMLESGDYVVVRFHGELRADKPILGYYFIAAGMRLFGRNPFGARFFSGVFGALCVALTFSLAKRMTANGRVALTAAACMATAPVMFVESKLCTVDAGLLLWTLLAMGALWRIYEGEVSWRVKALFWVALALGVLTKGPVILAAVFVPLVLLAVISADRSFLRRMGWLWGVPLAVIIVLPWAVAVQRATGGEFLRIALGRHVVERSQRALEGHSGFPGFYIVTLFGAFFPWAFFVPGAVVDVVRGLRRRRVELFLVCWAGGLLVVLELVSTKMVHYSLPAFPALAILVALFLERRRGERIILVGASFALFLAVLLAAGPAVMLWRYGMREAAYVFAGAGAILVSALAAAFLPSRREGGGVVRAAFAGALGWLFILAAWGMPVLGSYGSTEAVVSSIRRAEAQKGFRMEVASIGYREPSLVFALAGRVEFPNSVDELPAEPLRSQPRLLLISARRDGELEKLRDRMVVPWDVVEGFNFAKGRREEVAILMDYGSDLSDVTLPGAPENEDRL